MEPVTIAPDGRVVTAASIIADLHAQAKATDDAVLHSYIDADLATMAAEKQAAELVRLPGRSGSTNSSTPDTAVA